MNIESKRIYPLFLGFVANITLAALVWAYLLFNEKEYIKLVCLSIALVGSLFNLLKNIKAIRQHLINGEEILLLVNCMGIAFGIFIGSLSFLSKWFEEFRFISVVAGAISLAAIIISNRFTSTNT